MFLVYFILIKIMDVIKKLESVKCYFEEKLKVFENVLHSIDHIVIELQDTKCEYVGLAAAVDVLISDCRPVDEAIESFNIDLNNVSSIIKPTVHWHSNKKEMLEMFYLDGSSPWSVWLTYNPSKEIDILYKILEERHANGLLKKLKNPRVGDYICCYDKKILFRAVIIDVSNTRIKVINVDRYNVKIIKLDSCYEITRDLCEIHAYSIQCCLTKERRFKKKWNEDLGRLFQNTLRECRLTVRIVEEIQDIPPIFLVEMYAFNEALEVETNISNWILSRLLPELNNLSDDNDHVLDHFSDEALDPFLGISTISNSTETSNSENNKQSITDVLPTTTNGLVNYVSDTIQNISLEENCMKEKPRNRLAHLICPNTDVTLSLNASPKKEVCTNVDATVFLADDIASNLSFSNIHCSGGIPFSPEINGILPAGLNDGDQSNDIHDGGVMNGFYDHIVYEDSVIPGNYIPTDEQRICSFFSKKGFCWKPGCKKQHSKIEEDRWTADSAELFKDVINTLDLPTVGSVVILRVTHIVFCNTFYALLPDNFSDTDDCETADSLNKSLNLPEAKREFKFLQTPPCLGQFLLAYSSKKSLWLRASVRDIYDNNILQVFFVDFGITEELPLDKCREIDPQHVHLPCQAVYCTLANLFVESCNDEGKSFLESLVFDKEIEAEIVDCDINDNRLEIVAFHDGININQLLVDKGYCLPFKR